METNQVYTIVNETAQQAMGVKPIAAVDAQSLVSLGAQVFSSNDYTEGFMNTLAQRIGRTIMSWRAYRNSLSGMVMSDMQYGAIVQKIYVEVGDAEEDQSILIDGDSVDHYKVKKPNPSQKFFSKRTPYQYHITIQRKWLREAFLSPEAMSSFISMVFGKVRNKIEFALENLGRVCVANFIAETTKVIDLVSEYNSLTGKSITAGNAFYDEQFMRYALGVIKSYSKRLRTLSRSYNQESYERFTPTEDQRLMIYAEFQTLLETQVQYAAFHDEFVKLRGFIETPYWQSEDEPMSIEVNRASDGADTQVDNIVGVLYDRDALGIYKHEEEVLTTPVNAAGVYYNTYWHEDQLWFNDLSENFLVFTLN